MNGVPPSEQETAAYLDFVSGLIQDGIPLQGVLLYGLARPSFQPEAMQLNNVSEAWLKTFGGKIETLGLAVNLNL